MTMSNREGGDEYEEDYFSKEGNFEKESTDVWRSYNLLSLRIVD